MYDEALERPIWARMAQIPLFAALAYNRPDFVWDERANRPLILDHVTWCLRQEEEGTLFGAGPFTAPGTGRPGTRPDALCVFAAASADAVREILGTDPLVIAGIRHYEVFPWLLNQGIGRAAFDPAADV